MAYMNHRFVLFIVLLVLATTAGIQPSPAQRSEARVALAIGNADYPDAETPLRDTLSNVRSFADELRRNGFEVDVGENLTKEGMRAAIEKFYGKIKTGSVALIFFSGYGVQSNRQTYIVPVNAQIWTEPDVRRDGYSLDSVLAEMNSKGARVKIAIIDASRRNPFERRFRSVPAGLAPVIAPNNTAVMYAAAPSMVVRDSDRSLFVTELLKEIRSPGKIEEVFNRTLFSVSRASRGEQAPWFSSSLVEDFAFVQGTKAAESDRRPPPPPRPQSDADARREYQSAERVGTKKAWEDFVAKFPSGQYSDLARDRLAKLDSTRHDRRPIPTPTLGAHTSRRSASEPRRHGRISSTSIPPDLFRPRRDRLAKLDSTPARPRPDSDADARRAYQSAERIGTKKAWEDFLDKHPSGSYSDLARDRLAKLEPSPKPDARLGRPRHPGPRQADSIQPQ